jgi:hypothetical protein
MSPFDPFAYDFKTGQKNKALGNVDIVMPPEWRAKQEELNAMAPAAKQYERTQEQKFRQDISNNWWEQAASYPQEVVDAWQNPTSAEPPVGITPDWVFKQTQLSNEYNALPDITKRAVSWGNQAEDFMEDKAPGWWKGLTDVSDYINKFVGTDKLVSSPFKGLSLNNKWYQNVGQAVVNEVDVFKDLLFLPANFLKRVVNPITNFTEKAFFEKTITQFKADMASGDMSSYLNTMTPEQRWGDTTKPIWDINRYPLLFSSFFSDVFTAHTEQDQDLIDLGDGKMTEAQYWAKGIFKGASLPFKIIYNKVLVNPSNFLRSSIFFFGNVMQPNMMKGLGSDMGITHMQAGDYEQLTRQETGRFGNEETTNVYSSAARIAQEEYTRVYEEITAGDKDIVSDNKAVRENAQWRFANIAATAARKVEDEYIRANAKNTWTTLFGAPRSQTNPFGLTEEGWKQWHIAEGSRYSHMFGTSADERAESFSMLVSGGTTPSLAGSSTEEPWTESAFQIILDPNWVLNWDNLVLGIAWKGAVKPAFKGIAKGLEKMPGVKTFINFMKGATLPSIIRKQQMEVSNLMAYVRATSPGQEVTEKVMKQWLESTPEVMRAAGVYEHVIKSVTELQPYTDVILAAIKKSTDAAEIAAGVELALHEVTRKHPDWTVEALDTAAKEQVALMQHKKIWATVGNDVGKTIRESFGVEMAKKPKVVQFLNALLVGDNETAFARFSQGYKNMAYNNWLGLRFAWTTRNWVDNNVKLLLEGGPGIFKSIPDILEQYSKYGPTPEVSQELARIIRANKGVSFKSNNAILRAFMESGIFPPGIISGGMGATELLKEARVAENLPDLAKKIWEESGKFKPANFRPLNILNPASWPIMKQFAEWNYSMSGRVEMYASIRSYMHTFMKSIGEGTEDLLSHPVQIVLPGGAVQRVAPEFGDYFVAQLRKLPGGITPQDVKRIVEGFTSGKLRATLESRITDGVETLAPHIPVESINEFKRTFEALVVDGKLTEGDIDFALNKLVDNLRQGWLTNYRSLPELVNLGDVTSFEFNNLWNIVTQGSGKLENLDDVGLALDSFTRIGTAYKVQDLMKTHDFIEGYNALRKNPIRNADAIITYVEDFFNRRPAGWDNLVKTQDQLLTKIVDSIDSFSDAAVKSIPPVPSVTVPTIVERRLAKHTNIVSALKGGLLTGADPKTIDYDVVASQLEHLPDDVFQDLRGIVQSNALPKSRSGSAAAYYDASTHTIHYTKTSTPVHETGHLLAKQLGLEERLTEQIPQGLADDLFNASNSGYTNEILDRGFYITSTGKRITISAKSETAAMAVKSFLSDPKAFYAAHPEAWKTIFKSMPFDPKYLPDLPEGEITKLLTEDADETFGTIMKLDGANAIDLSSKSTGDIFSLPGSPFDGGIITKAVNNSGEQVWAVVKLDSGFANLLTPDMHSLLVENSLKYGTSTLPLTGFDAAGLTTRKGKQVGRIFINGYPGQVTVRMLYDEKIGLVVPTAMIDIPQMAYSKTSLAARKAALLKRQVDLVDFATDELKLTSLDNFGMGISEDIKPWRSIPDLEGAVAGRERILNLRMVNEPNSPDIPEMQRALKEAQDALETARTTTVQKEAAEEAARKAGISTWTSPHQLPKGFGHTGTGGPYPTIYGRPAVGTGKDITPISDILGENVEYKYLQYDKELTRLAGEIQDKTTMLKRLRVMMQDRIQSLDIVDPGGLPAKVKEYQAALDKLKLRDTETRHALETIRVQATRVYDYMHSFESLIPSEAVLRGVEPSKLSDADWKIVRKNYADSVLMSGEAEQIQTRIDGYIRGLYGEIIEPPKVRNLINELDAAKAEWENHLKAKPKPSEFEDATTGLIPPGRPELAITKESAFREADAKWQAEATTLRDTIFDLESNLRRGVTTISPVTRETFESAIERASKKLDDVRIREPGKEARIVNARGRYPEVISLDRPPRSSSMPNIPKPGKTALGVEQTLREIPGRGELTAYDLWQKELVEAEEGLQRAYEELAAYESTAKEIPGLKPGSDVRREVRNLQEQVDKLRDQALQKRVVVGQYSTGRKLPVEVTPAKRAVVPLGEIDNTIVPPWEEEIPAEAAIPPLDGQIKGEDGIKRGLNYYPLGTFVKIDGVESMIQQAYIQANGSIAYDAVTSAGKHINITEPFAQDAVTEFSPLATMQSKVQVDLENKLRLTQDKKMIIDAYNGLTGAMRARAQALRDIMPDYWKGRAPADFDDSLGLINVTTDQLWQASRFKAMDDIHQALHDMKLVLMKKGYQPADLNAATAATSTANWWLNEATVDDALRHNSRSFKTQLEEILSMRKDILSNRTTPVEMPQLVGRDRDILSQYGTKLAEDFRQLISDSQTKAVDARNKMLFDYANTPNWMATLGGLFPFVRYPAKNIPYWLDTFSETPHLLGSVAMLRQAQYNINAANGYPEKDRYNINIPMKLQGALFEAFGMDNSYLSINPWSMFSFMSQTPAMTMYDSARIQEMAIKNEGEPGSVPWFRSVNEIASQIGFQRWPFIDFIMGSFGLFGQTWYPSDWIGSWTTMANWAMTELFGETKATYNIDFAIRKYVPKVWNAVFAGFPGMAWEEVNADNMLTWAQGKEVEKYMREFNNDAAIAIRGIDSTRVTELIREMVDTGTFEEYQKAVEPIFDLEGQEQATALLQLDEYHLAAFIDELQDRALMKAVRKAAIQIAVGDTTGVYGKFNNMSEKEGAQLRMTRRAEIQRYTPGEQRRAAMTAWDADHPQQSLIQTYRFDSNPFAETQAGEELTKWQLVIDDYRDRFYAERKNIVKAMETEQARYFAIDPTGTSWTRSGKPKFFQMIADCETKYNTQVKEELRRRVNTYKRYYPNDMDGIHKLEYGWEEDVYSQVELNDAEREELYKVEKAVGRESAAYTRAFAEVYAVAAARRPVVTKKHVPGIEEGINIHLEWSPSGNANYSKDEQERFFTESILRKLQEGAPKQDDEKYVDDDGTLYWADYEAYMKNLSTTALTLPEVQEQVIYIMDSQGLDHPYAVDIVKQWYTEKKMADLWAKNDTIYDAMAAAYKNNYLKMPRDIWYKQIGAKGLDLKNTNPELYSMLQADLDVQYNGIEAGMLIPYIVDNPAYAAKFASGEWTVAKLISAFTNVQLPGFFASETNRKPPEELMVGFVYDAMQVMTPQQLEEFTTKMNMATDGAFSDHYLSTSANRGMLDLATQFAIAQAAALVIGKELPMEVIAPIINEDIDKESQELLKRSGVVFMGTADQKEFEEALFINSQALRARYLSKDPENDPTVQGYENNPLWQKYFKNRTGAALWWDTYFNLIPPGPVSESLTGQAIIGALLDPSRIQIVDKSEYQPGIDMARQWITLYQDQLLALDLKSSEFPQVRALFTEYYKLPLGTARLEFRKLNPLFEKYYKAKLVLATDTASPAASGGAVPKSGTTTSKSGTTAPKSGTTAPKSGSGGGGSSKPAPLATTAGDWNVFKSAVGQNFMPVMRMLIGYWNTNEMNGALDNYMKKLYSQLEISIPYEQWLTELKYWFGKYGATGGVKGTSTTAIKAPPEPVYNRGSSGIRRER